MKYLKIFLLSCIFISSKSQIIDTDKLFDIHFIQNFEDNTVGPYHDNDDEWSADWNHPSWSNRPPSEIIQTTDYVNNKNLKFFFPQGSVGPETGGGHWHVPLNTSLEELYLTYRIRFKEGFDWVNGGKMPGIRGGPEWSDHGPPGWSDGFYFLLMWANYPGIDFYYYHHDQTAEYGSSKAWDDNITTGVWYTITLRLVMNSVGDTGGYSNGIAEGFINGKLSCQLTNVKFRNLSEIGIDNLLIASFFGGSGEDFAATQDENIEFDDFYAFTYKPGVDVPQGRTPSTSDRILYLPYQQVVDSLWAKSIKATAISSRSVNIEWRNFLYSVNYTIQRKKFGETDFTDLITLSSPAITYTNTGLDPTTEYIYRIKVENYFTDEVSASTLPVSPPNQPSSLYGKNIGKNSITIKWTDNSNNETGFIVERSLNGVNFTQIASLSRNITEYTNNSLTPNSAYTYRIKAFNEDGSSGYSNALTLSTLPPDIPAIPTELASKNITKKSANVSWSDNSLNESGFEIYLCDNEENNFILYGKTTINENYLTINDLLPNITYRVKVRSYNEEGFSDYSNTESFTTLPLSLPIAPSSLDYDSSSTDFISLEWIDRSDNETGFYIYRSHLDTLNYQLIATVSLNQDSYLDAGLTEHSTYYYRVEAFNDDGKSPFSNVLKIITVEPVNPPGNFVITEFTVSSASFSWQDNSQDEAGFQIERAQKDGYFSKIASLGANITQYTDQNLSSNTTYLYRIRSFNFITHSKYSQILSVTTKNIDLPAPSSLSATYISPETITITWTDNSSNEEGFSVFRADSNLNFILVSAVNADINSYIDQIPLPGKDYYYRICAFNSSDTSEFSKTLFIKGITIDPPNAPFLLPTHQNLPDKISLNWNDNSFNETSFVIKRALFPEENFETIQEVGENETSFIDTDVNPNSTYLYIVNAKNTKGISKNSNTAKISTASFTESLRCKENLIAYYNFNLNSDTIIHDYSGFGDPSDLLITDTSKIKWNSNSRFEIKESTVIRSLSKASKIVDACRETNEISLECWIKPSANNYVEEAKIISLSGGEDSVGISVMQSAFNHFVDKYDYYVALSTQSTNINGTPFLSTKYENKSVNLHHLVYTRNSTGNEKIYLNGNLLNSSIKPSNINWSENFYLYLGNENMTDNWTGVFYLLAIYSKELSLQEIQNNFKVGPTDSVKQAKNSFEVKYNPNPAKGNITIEIKPTEITDYVSEAYLQILDLNGAILHEEMIKNSNETYSKQMDLSFVKSGFYFIRILTSNNSQTFKLLVQ